MSGPDDESLDPIFFLKGLVIGFAMAVPIGPLGVLSVRKTLADGHARGMVIGLGAATADSLYAGIAAFGLTIVSDVITSQYLWLRLGGGALLLFLGIRTFRAKRRNPNIPSNNKGMLGSYVSSFFIALTNPVTIFAFFAVFAVFGLGQELGVLSACLLVVGVFSGSALWFLSLGYVATMFRKKLDSGGLQWVNKIAGVLIFVSGLAAFVSLV